MRKGIYAGSFDPVTLGHMDQIKRAAKLCDVLVVAVISNINKNAMFTLEERVRILKRELSDIQNVEVKSFSGFAVDFAEQENATILFRGLRNNADYEYEATMANYNRDLNPEVETVFLPTTPEFSYISSSGVKEIVSFGGDISKYVSERVAEDILSKIK